MINLISRRDFLRMVLTIPISAISAACYSRSATPIPPSTLRSISATRTNTNTPVDKVPSATIPEYLTLVKNLDFPEGPAFDPEGNLWCTEMGTGNLIRWVDGQVETIQTHGRPNGLAFDRSGRAWITDSSLGAIRVFDRRDDSWTTIIDSIDGQPLQTPNDLVFDQNGNLLFTCPNFYSEEPDGYVVCLSPDGTATPIAEGMHRPNGIGLLPKSGELIVADTHVKALYRGSWDPITIEWHSPSEWLRVGGREGPDGMAIDTDGDIYCAVFGDGIVKQISNEGQLTEEIILPGSNPTNAAIDPTGKLGLVVTEAEQGLLLSFPGIKAIPALFDGGSHWK